LTEQRGRLTGKRAIITGAGSGIGKAIALRFQKEGASVGLVDRDAAALENARPTFDDHPPAVLYQADVSVEAQVEEAFQAVSAELGWVDVVVANAGVQLFGRDAPVHQLDLSAWELTMDVNLTGMFLTCKYGVRELLKVGHGSIICMGSPTGLRGTASGFHAYSASKAGVFGLVRVMAAEYARQGIRLNALVPGFTDTNLVRAITEDADACQKILRRVPMGRCAQPEEIASVAVFLASDEASFVTGATYIADGGETVL
jgi:NAD(P)-dependent dehydrogenase (short-subunit alcohol dehydrogenase family)